MEQLRTAYDRDRDRLYSRHRAEGDQRLKTEASEERKFVKSLKDKQDTDMKQFLVQQKSDYRQIKNIFKKVYTLHVLYV